MESLDAMISKLPIVRRGFSPDEVRRKLDELNKNLSSESFRCNEMLKQIADLESQAQRPAPELTEAVVAKLLGEQAAEILRNSAAASTAIREKAETEARSVTALAQRERDEASAIANALLSEARERATELIAGAQSEAKTTITRADATAQERLASQEMLAKEIIGRANQIAGETIQAAQKSADKIMSESQAEATSLISSARETRTEILSDLRMRADEVRSHIDTLSRTRGWFIEMLRDAQRRVTGVETALSVSISSDLESLEGSLEALNLSTIEVRPTPSTSQTSIAQPEKEETLAAEVISIDAPSSTNDVLSSSQMSHTAPEEENVINLDRPLGEEFADAVASEDTGTKNEKVDEATGAPPRLPRTASKRRMPQSNTKPQD